MAQRTKDLLACETFLRNSSYWESPFMIKGSLITRQFFENPEARHIQDIDWVYLNHIEDYELAGQVFSEWVTKITEMSGDERVRFRSFKENDFWRRIDYAVKDDFPTVNTDLLYYFEEKEEEIEFDISFNLEVLFPPEELLYKPIFGTPFKLPKVCPYAHQVSWKLHQLLFRPRLKDIFDLIHLLNHERFNQEEFEKIIFALKKECKRDGIYVNKIIPYINYGLVQNLGIVSDVFRHFFGRPLPKDFKEAKIPDYEIGWFTSRQYFPYKRKSELLKHFGAVLRDRGFEAKMFI